MSSRRWLAPVLVDLMERGFVSRSPQTAPESFTTSKWRSSGQPLEDVDEALGPGRFGMSEEAGRMLNELLTCYVKPRRGRPW